MVRLVWFRNDLRVADQTALASAARDGPVVAVWCLCPEQLHVHDVGGDPGGLRPALPAGTAAGAGGLGIPLRILAPAELRRSAGGAAETGPGDRCRQVSGSTTSTR
ncbi:MAG: deoxyribodipyrimidine photo-lyase [Gammaproteobacteria bacterium]|nr:deoxyribodipyrimidine photo-lyase [Gammaproteobacteria bacterium]